MLDVTCTQASKQNVLDRIIVAHADLGRIEWNGCASLAERQASLYGVRFWKMARPQGDLLEHAEEKGMWPGHATRYCTSDHKRGQIQKLFTELSRTLPGEKLRILNCLGMRAEESTARAKLSIYEKNNRASTKTDTRIVYNSHAIKHWGVDEVWANIKATGIPYHFAYDLGMPRLSCCFCIFAPREALVLAGQHNPGLLQEYVDAEERMGHTFRVDLSMKEIQDEVNIRGGPIVVPDWKM